MSRHPRTQRHRHRGPSYRLLIFKVVVALGQVASLVKLLFHHRD